MPTQHLFQMKACRFDDVNTADKEDLQDMIHQATTITIKELETQLGNNPEDWKWGRLHKASFTNPIRRSGFGKELLGAKSYSMELQTQANQSSSWVVVTVKVVANVTQQVKIQPIILFCKRNAILVLPMIPTLFIQR